MPENIKEALAQVSLGCKMIDLMEGIDHADSLKTLCSVLATHPLMRKMNDSQVERVFDMIREQRKNCIQVVQSMLQPTPERGSSQWN